MKMRNLLCCLAVLAALAGAPARAADRSWGPFTYETVKIADGVVGFVEPKLNAIVSSNVIAVIGEKSILVFDTGHHPPVTRAIVAEIRKLSAKPVRYVVVSHWHDDHWTGNAEFAAAWPALEVIAHPFTAGLMNARKDKFHGAPCKAELEKELKPQRERLASGKREDGTPLSDKSKAFLADAIAGLKQSIAECGQARFRGADLTFDSRLDIDLGGRRVELRHVGRANTGGDVVAWIPDVRTLLTGDMVVHPFPFATQSYITEWGAALRKLEALQPAIVVPGHGAVEHDLDYLRQLAALFESLSSQAHAAWKPGMSADDLRKQIDIASWSEKFSHDDKFIKANFDYMIGQPGIDRLWQELSGQWKPESDE
ncbi:MAG TPA: MBL fold metallo-hydrolase [Rudaea sp.]|nr:MBL fold metallo-hydrolase [Rudaea sp.]